MLVDKPRLFFAASEGSGGAAVVPSVPNAPPSVPPTTPATDGKVPPAPAGTTPQPSGAELPDDPIELKRRLSSLLTTHEEMRTKYDTRMAAEEKAKADALKEQGKYKELYDAAAPKIEQLTRYEKALAGYVEAETKALPPAIAALMPEGDAVSKLEWIGKAKASGAIPETKPGQRGPDGSPPPGGKSGKTMTLAAFNALSAQEQMDYMVKDHGVVVG